MASTAPGFSSADVSPASSPRYAARTTRIECLPHGLSLGDRCHRQLLQAAGWKRIEVVGVVDDGQYVSVAEASHPGIFRPIRQQPPLREIWLVVRSNRAPERLSAEMRSKIRELDAGLPLEVKTWTAVKLLALD
jgi:hypothetical protein